MYSIIRQGGMQFRAEKGSKLEVPKLEAEVGSEIEIKEVLLFSGNELHVGRPVIENAVIRAKILSHGKGDKVKVFKKKRRKRYRRTVGHRQEFTLIEVTGMECQSEKA